MSQNVIKCACCGINPVDVGENFYSNHHENDECEVICEECDSNGHHEFKKCPGVKAQKGSE